MNPSKQQKIQQLKQWMVQKGCLIHPDVQIPSFINGYQGVATKSIIPPKTLIIAVPSSLILTVTKCYKDPLLKSIFVKNDDLFDYEASDDCQFNVLCVFLMYHKMNIEKSEWKIYLETIGEPETAVDWPDKMLKGLNKSAIEEILHIRIECDKLRDQLSAYLKTTQQFCHFPLQQIKECFNYCYRAVMTRCFGYYFGQASLIPVADLINHGCQVVDHQLINAKFERNLQYSQDYKEKSDKIDCELLGIKRGKNVLPPFRQRYLISNNLVECDIEALSELNRKNVDGILAEYNQKLLREDSAVDIADLEFCDEDDSEDNDTDVDQQTQREMQLQRMHLEELEQIENFKKYHESVKVETYKQVEDRFEKYEKELGAENSDMETVDGTMGQSRNDVLIGEVKVGGLEEEGENIEMKENKLTQQKNNQQTLQCNEEDWEDEEDAETKKTHQSKRLTQNSQLPPQQQTTLTKQPTQSHSQSTQSNSLFFEHKPPTTPNLAKPNQKPLPKATVPIHMVDSSESESEDDQEWGLLPDSYFTLSTSSAVGANKQLYNSYGSRTNKFLLIWYGFCYRDNLYDSVTLRLHVQFHKQLPSANSIVLDTYVGGQGLTFRKNEHQVVKGNEVSKEFRLKLNKTCMKLLTFLRLYLLDYYKGADLYKICVTLPSSIDFEQLVLKYYKQIVESLYDRYPLHIVNELRQQLSSEDTPEPDKTQINFKLIYLEEQRKILDSNMDTVDCLLEVWRRVKQRKEKREHQATNSAKANTAPNEFDKSYYNDFTIYQLRKLQHYLTSLKKNFSYLLYHPAGQSPIPSNY